MRKRKSSGLGDEVNERFADAMAMFRDSTQRHRISNQTWRFTDVPPSWDNTVKTNEDRTG